MAKKIKKNKKDNTKLSNKVVKKKDRPKKEKVKKEKVNFFRRIVVFFKELKSELKKIVWPSKKELFVSTFVVIVAIAVMAVFVVFADLLFHSILKVMIRNL